MFLKCDVTCSWTLALSHLGPPLSVTYFMDGPDPDLRKRGPNFGWKFCDDFLGISQQNFLVRTKYVAFLQGGKSMPAPIGGQTPLIGKIYTI